jgi:hypothetical protein
MKNKWVIVFAAVMLLCCYLLAQSRFPSPPPPMEPAPPPRPAKTRVQRNDPLELQREAREVSDLARTIPADVDNVNRGIISKDLGEKLKRIEKLSKQLRSDVAR